MMIDFASVSISDLLEMIQKLINSNDQYFSGVPARDIHEVTMARLAANELKRRLSASANVSPPAWREVYEKVIAKMDDGGSVGRGGECDISVANAAVALMFSKSEISRLNAWISELRGRERHLRDTLAGVEALISRAAASANVAINSGEARNKP